MCFMHCVDILLLTSCVYVFCLLVLFMFCGFVLC